MEELVKTTQTNNNTNNTTSNSKNDSDLIANIIANSYFKQKLKVTELQIYQDVEIKNRIEIEGQVNIQDKMILDKLKLEIQEGLLNLYSKEKAKEEFAKMWKVELSIFDVGGKFNEIQLTNVKGYKEGLKPFEDEICFIEFYDATLGQVEGTNEIVLIGDNSYKKFKDSDLKRKKIINYIGISNLEDNKFWLEFLKKFNLRHDGENMFQFNRKGAAEELGIVNLPYVCICDTKGKIQYAGDPRKINIDKFLTTLCDNGKGEIVYEDFEENSEIKCNCPNCSKKVNNGTKRIDPNPSWTNIEDELKIEILRECNQNLENLGLHCKFFVYRVITHEFKETSFYTKIFFKGYLNEDEEGMVQSLIWNLKDMWGFEDISIEKMEKSSNSGMNGLGLLKLIAAMSSLKSK